MSEGFATLGTLIRLCSCVNSFMLREVYVLVEGSATLATLVRSFSGMYFPVLNEG